MSEGLQSGAHEIHEPTGFQPVVVQLLSNQGKEALIADCTFRVSGKAPELWDPVLGSIEPAAVYGCKDGATTLPVSLDQDGSVFVVFRKPASANPVVSLTTEPDGPTIPGSPIARPPILEDGRIILETWQPTKYTLSTAQGMTKKRPTGVFPQPIEVTGPWQLTFPPELGAPAAATFNKLDSWTNSKDDGVKHLSGTATYVNEFTVPSDWLRSGKKFLSIWAR